VLSGFRLTRLQDCGRWSTLDPMRRQAVPRVQGGGLAVAALATTDSVFRIVKELHTAEQGQWEVFCNAKTQKPR
jgi:hypothetical protein